MVRDIFLFLFLPFEISLFQIDRLPNIRHVSVLIDAAPFFVPMPRHALSDRFNLFKFTTFART